MALPIVNLKEGEEAVGSLLKTTESSNMFLEETNKNISSLVHLQKKMIDKFDNFFETLAFDKEKEKLRKRKGDKPKSIKAKDGLFKGLKDSLGGFSLGDALALAFGSWLLGLDKFLKLTLFPSLTRGLSRIFDFKRFGEAIAKPIITIFDALGDVFGKRGTNQFLKANTYKALGRTTKFLRDLGDVFARMEKLIFNTKPFKATVTAVTNGFVFIQNTMKSLVKPISVFGSVLSKIGTLFVKLKPIAKLLKFAKFALGPLSMTLFALFDFVKGFREGFLEGGVLEGLKEGFLEIARGFITKPLDLLKDIVSWSADKLGFENFAEILRSFSFTDIFNVFMMKIEGMFQVTAQWLSEAWQNPTAALESLRGSAWNIISGFGKMVHERIIKPIGTWIDGMFANINTEGMKDKFFAGFEVIKNFGSRIYERFFQPILDVFTSIGNKISAIKLPDISFDNFEFPKPEDILPKIGEILNEFVQGLAELLDVRLLPDSIARGISTLGVNLAQAMGTKNIAVYNPKTNEREIFNPQNVENEDALSGTELRRSIRPNPTITGSNINNSVSRIENKKEVRLTKLNNMPIIAPNNTTNVVNNRTVTSGNVSSRPMQNPLGAYN